MAPAKATRQRRTKAGANSKKRIVRISLSALDFPSPDDLRAFEQYWRKNEAQRLEQCMSLIREVVLNDTPSPNPDIALAIRESTQALPGYATLDLGHRTDIAALVKTFSEYLKDNTRKRPLNALMLAEPGAGKSHFIDRIASRMRTDRVSAVTFNMATMQNYDDLAQPIDELRNLKVRDQFPLLFLDEFDSDPKWYATLLPLLWDGAIHIGHRDLRLGKAIVVLAGSNPSLPRLMKESGNMQLLDANEESERRQDHGKLVDLLSRINSGVIDIPSLDIFNSERDRRADKICVAVALITARFGEHVTHVPRGLLRFIANVQFRYAVRSIAHLIDMIDANALQGTKLVSDKLGLPLSDRSALQKSSLSLHLKSADSGLGIVNMWEACNRRHSDVIVQSKQLRYFPSAPLAGPP